MSDLKMLELPVWQFLNTEQRQMFREIFDYIQDVCGMNDFQECWDIYNLSTSVKNDTDHKELMTRVISLIKNYISEQSDDQRFETMVVNGKVIIDVLSK